MDKLLEKLWNCVARDASLTFQLRLFRLFCLTAGILCLAIILPANAWQDLPFVVNIANVVLGVFALYCYRESRQGRHHILLFFVITVLMLNPVWFFNGGSDGSVTYYFFPLVIYPMALFRDKVRWLAVAGLTINVCGLLLLEHLFPSWVTPFKTPSDRVTDLVSGIFCSYVAITVLIWVVITNYDKERERIASYAHELGISEANYRSVVENAKTVILRINPQGRITFFNRFAEELFGYQRQEIVGQPLLGTLVPGAAQSGEDLSAKMEDILRHPERQPQHESENLRRDGRRLRIIWTYQPIYDERKELREILCVGADVTERAALLEQLELTQRTVDSAADQVIWTDENARILYANGAVTEKLGYTAEELRDLTLKEISADTTGSVWEQHQQSLKHEGSLTYEGVQRRKDGTTLAVEVTATHLLIGDKAYITAFIRDISTRKQAEENLERINQQLVVISRQAGMAEVAVSVLHNVGNALNSATVSAGLIANQLRKSRLGSLSRLAELIGQNEQDLKRFFTEDRRCRQIPSFIKSLSQHLNDDQARLLGETETLIQSIEHIRDIVSTQQSSARVVGLVETLSLADLVEDSLRMNAQSFERKHIRVVREFQPIPSVTVDKHKVLQILVNLVRNAQNACVESTQSTPRIIVRVAAKGSDTVSVSVEDNGMGIAPENMTRIFNYGFTTRKDGHGFGLHSGALTAREMGGSLTAQSDGPGLGARFTLELPLQPPSKSGITPVVANQPVQSIQS